MRSLQLSAPVFFIILYICSYYVPLFGEHVETLSDRGITADKVLTADQTASQDKWFIIDSRYFEIYYTQAVDLKTVTRRLERRGLFTSGVYDPNPASAPPEKIAYRMDMLLKRVKEILDMNPNMPRLKMKIFKDKNELNEEYRRIFGTTGDMKSFYIHKYNTIYTSEEDISDSVIAHEMGHAIVDHYFSTIPPEKIRELLASYVDLHLDEEED